MKMIISGGGTGGHIYPALAIAEGVRERLPDARILYVGSRRGMESTLAPERGYDYAAVDISGIDRSSMLKASQSLVKFPKSFFQGWDIIKEFKPDVVVGTGGYASFPVVLASTFFSCRSYIHEQNAQPGLANRNLAGRVDCVMLTFAEAAPFLNAKRIEITGLPVRKAITTVNRDRALCKWGFSPGIFTLVVFGGSQGAASINRAMLGYLERDRAQPSQVIWMTGHNQYPELMEQLKGLEMERSKVKLVVKPYLEHIEDALAVADLAVCRAGAGTLSELAVLGLAAILVPYPYASDNHQEKNARALLEKKAADMIIDEFLDGDTLYGEIQLLRHQPDILRHMGANMKKEAKPKALEDILDIILS
ncbi:MAG: undecaprenyldiphospho-muramoylpentapeptide beta-N-acetylglucosaminyltransferase [Syntrophomonadaceae bacterium]|jgi:UDP-N-acetylglucosamine--N-acetylmuramyl-(pentapeptide) pyrophosphoryl-undecaprenol N-acetylglucosamine transferase